MWHTVRHCATVTGILTRPVAAAALVHRQEHGARRAVRQQRNQLENQVRHQRL